MTNFSTRIRVVKVCPKYPCKGTEGVTSKGGRMPALRTKCPPQPPRTADDCEHCECFEAEGDECCYCGAGPDDD